MVSKVILDSNVTIVILTRNRCSFFCRTYEGTITKQLRQWQKPSILSIWLGWGTPRFYIPTQLGNPEPVSLFESNWTPPPGSHEDKDGEGWNHCWQRGKPGGDIGCFSTGGGHSSSQDRSVSRRQLPALRQQCQSIEDSQNPGCPGKCLLPWHHLAPKHPINLRPSQGDAGEGCQSEGSWVWAINGKAAPERSKWTAHRLFGHYIAQRLFG